MRFLVLLLLSLPTITLGEPLRIFTTVLPLKTFAEQIGGQHVQTHSVVQAGHNPHTYEPTPQQIAALSKATLYIRTGMPFEHAWMPRLRAANPHMHILDAHPLDTHQSAESHTPTHHHAAHEHAFDPHVWTSPPKAAQMAKRIRNKLIELDPDHATDYRRQYAALAQSLEQMHQTINDLLSPLQNREFIVFHPAWGHFAQTYGLTQTAIEYEGKEPGIRTLAHIIKHARQTNARVIFAQPQFDQRMAAQVAKAIDGKVILVDPLAADYSHNLRQVATQFAQALRP